MSKTVEKRATEVKRNTTGTRQVAVVVPPAQRLEAEQVRKVVGAKNVMGTCSG